jgi:hypothetical protein
MVASRDGPEGGVGVRFGLGVLMLLLLPSEVGYQDLAALIARAPLVVERSQKGALASPFGTIHEPNFSIPRPVGAAIPPSLGFTLVGLDPNSADITGSIRERILGEGAMLASSFAGPLVDRSKKGDYGVARKADRQMALKGDRLAPIPQAVVTRADVTKDLEQPEAEPSAPAVAQVDAEAPLREQPVAPTQSAEQNTEDAGGYALASARSVTSLAFASADVDPALRAARLYFSIDPMGQKLGAIEPWAPGEEPKFEDTDVAATAGPENRPATVKSDANIKLAALPSEALPGQYGGVVDVPVERADLPPLPSDPGVVTKNDVRGGQTVAPKGQVTGEGQRPMTPAERLGLDEKSRAKAEKCLTEVIYFEARGEVVRGQMAVAQVVLNRAFSGKYPSTVCGVVYQNSHRHLACQFTFACDGIPDVVREPDMWERAKVIASEMLDGKLWLPEVGKATHYHAYWVRPDWVREMTKMHKLGVHTFYRPRAWGDGAEAPEWGDTTSTTESAKKLVEAAKKL